MNVTLREITMENFRECLDLSIAEDQKGFVSSNVYSLAAAKVDGVSNPLAIYVGAQMVGFIMYDFEPKEDRGYITRLMVDARFQRNGYGRAAIIQVIDRLKAVPDCCEIYTSFVPANTAAAKLYASLGFEITGETTEDGTETAAQLKVA